MPELLKPTTDLVFKLLLQRDPKLGLLRSMLECIFGSDNPITELEVLNPDLDPDHPADKPISLDVRVHRKGVSRIDIEMQALVHTRLACRILYYWAREYGLELKRGESYQRLIPIVSVIWLGENLLKSQQFHSVFHLSEDNTRETFSSDIEVHTLELPKLHLLTPETNPGLYRWSRFLTATTPEEFERLANEDPTMNNAKKTLEEISADDDVRIKAYHRESALRAHVDALVAEHEDGFEQGRVKGRVEGRVDGLREMLHRQLTKRFGELPPWASARVTQAEIGQLEIYLDAVLTAPTIEAALQLNA